MRLIYFCILGILLSSSLFLTEELNGIGNYLIVGFISLLCCTAFLFKNKQFYIKKNIVIILYIFVFVNIIGQIFHPEANLVFNTVAIILLYCGTQFAFANIKANKNKVLYKILFYSQLSLIFLSFITHGLSFESYQGIFGNPNSYGIVATTLFVCYLANYAESISFYFEKGKITKNFILKTSIAFLLFITVALSQSTNSLIACIISFSVIIFAILIKMTYFKKLFTFIYRLIKLVFLSFLVIYPLSLLTKVDNLLLESILFKFRIKAAQGDILNSRGDIWSSVINDAKLFGYGSDYLGNIIKMDAHNTFIKILSENGLLSLMAFGVILFIFLTNSIKHVIYSEEEMKFLPLLLTVVFICLSMGESMMFSLPMNAMFLSMASIFSVNKINFVSKKTNVIGSNYTVTKSQSVT